FGFCNSSLSGTVFRQLGPQIGAGFNSAMKIGEVEFFVRAMGIVVIQAPAQQQRIDSKLLPAGGHDWNRASLAHKNRLLAERSLNGVDRSGHVGAIERDHDPRRSMKVD